jgi:hypothetical protein
MTAAPKVGYRLRDEVVSSPAGTFDGEATDCQQSDTDGRDPQLRGPGIG